MSSTSISQEKKNEIDKLLTFATGKYAGMPTPRPDPNNKTITTSIVQGGVRTTTTTLKPTRKLSLTEELDKVLSLGSARY